VYVSEDGARITSLLERSRIFAGQAPEAFLFGKYLEANRALLPERILKINGSTEPAVMAGMDIAMIPGDEGNFKITTKGDLERFREMLGSFDAGI
jgi:2-C-methyl-D-erythritol 4-phosphate cytidylyltransferase